MSNKILLWIGIIGAVTTSFLPANVFAKITGSIAKPNLQSQQFFTIAQNIVPEAIAYFKSANQKYLKQDYQGALADYNRAIQIDPNFAQPYGNRGLIKMEQLRDARGALADYNRAIQLDPNFAKAYSNRALIKQEQPQDYQGALADYNRAIQLDPNFAQAYGNRGSLRHNFLNDRAGGTTDMQTAIQLFQQQGNTGKYQEMIAILKEWQKTDKKLLERK